MILPPQMFAGSFPGPGRFQTPSNDSPNAWKPKGGIWTSTYEDGTSAWERWCRSEGFALHRLAQRWILQPVDANVFAIQERADVDRLMADYGVPLYPGQTGGVQYETLDWELFADDYDALWLSSPWLNMDEGMPLRLASMLFYGWDCESTWWARWLFDDDVRMAD